jgi:hypothetical protein
MREMRNAYVSAGNHEEERPPERPKRKYRIILKCVF